MVGVKALQVRADRWRGSGWRGWRRRSAPAAAVRVGPLDFTEVDDPDAARAGLAPRPHPAGRDLRQRPVDDRGPRVARTSTTRVSFPFVPGHEVVGDLDDGARVVLEPVLGHAARGFEPPFDGAAPGDGDDYAHLATGRLEPGIQTGFCCSTGGGWAPWFWAHESAAAPRRRRRARRAGRADRAARRRHPRRPRSPPRAPSVSNADEPVVAVLGAGTMGLAAVAGLVRYVPQARVVVGARYPHQQRLARALGAHEVVPAAELARAVRRIVGCHVVGDHLSSRCPRRRSTPSATATSLADVLRITRPRGRVVMMGMPAEVTVDLTGLWHRETELVGAYTYGTETLDGRRVRTFDLAIETADRHRRRALAVSATYRLADHVDAIAHAAAAGRRGATKIAFDLRSQLMPRPGFVLDVDRSTPPTLFWRGEGFSLEKLPADRSRVIYPPEPLAPIDDIDGAIRDALLNPLDQDPLPHAAVPGHEADDRLRRHQPAAAADAPTRRPPAGHRGRARPRRRGRRRRRPPHLRPRPAPPDDRGRAAPRRRRPRLRRLRAARDAHQHDAEDPDNLTYLGTTPHGEEVEINKRAAESDLLVYVNINLVAMDGGWKSTATGLASYRSLRHHHNPTTMEASHSFMDQHRSELHKSNWRMGKVLVDSGVKVFQIETTLNTDTFPSPFDFLSKREWEWTAEGPGTLRRRRRSRSSARPTRLARKIFHSIEAPHQMTSVQAGEVEAVHKLTTENVYRQQLVEVAGSDRHPDDGHPVHLPVQRQLDHEPDPRDVHGPRLPVQHVPRQAARARGRGRDHDPPDAARLPPGAPPELHRLLRAGAGRDHRPARDVDEVRGALRRGRVVPPPLPHEATPTTACTRSTCGTGAPTGCSTAVG